MNRNSLIFLYFICLTVFADAQTPPALRRFLALKSLAGASVSLMARDVASGDTLYAYGERRELTPASVMKLVTTAAALEILGEEYRYLTSVEYDGVIRDDILDGNIYIKGSGDPTLGSAHFSPDRESFSPDDNTFAPQWVDALLRAGIKNVKGNVVADESVFDSEGISMKWLSEDLGSYYGAGSYGLSVFDNLCKIYVDAGAVGTKPELATCVPQMPGLCFHNYLTAATSTADSVYVVGAPYSNDRYLYGIVPANTKRHVVRGDIPDPPLFLATYIYMYMQSSGIGITGSPTSFRILSESNQWRPGVRKRIAVTQSPSLREIVRVVNERSHNLYADALFKTLGLSYLPRQGEKVSSFGKGAKIVREHWAKNGMDVSSLWMFDGSGLAITDKVTAGFLCDLLTYMAVKSPQSEAFVSSLPMAGMEGSVRNFLRGSALQGKARLKSGGMSRVRSYAGYIDKGGKRYAVAVIVNNYSGAVQAIVHDLENLLLELF
ncbi:MAG: D-alanyl-D-alanine carboxypeptidase/D-alanyl-D-alanine-endopeptidase [Tannerellaceae bacterium]|jgi:D-alanyl-D-alanine carboxypeptidase/D-alanyl-D-alanine-endopeptidase (penicillin-binding protein 4)|nr:D-alanyl-D-alanine carboxypeptidase/D-alanyl-D-alanine-endopeptidase [Tannerellaceae bacterium]